MNKPKFSIFRADGSKVPTLKKAFLVKEHISLKHFRHNSLILEDGTEWEMVVENAVEDGVFKNASAFCIVSYQAHTHGNYAVVRLVAERSTASLTTEDMQSWAAS